MDATALRRQTKKALDEKVHIREHVQLFTCSQVREGAGIKATSSQAKLDKELESLLNLLMGDKSRLTAKSKLSRIVTHLRSLAPLLDQHLEIISRFHLNLSCPQVDNIFKIFIKIEFRKQSCNNIKKLLFCDENIIENGVNPFMEVIQYVYKMIISVIISPGFSKESVKKWITQKFIINLIYQLKRETDIERNYAKLLLYKIYTKFIGLREDIIVVAMNVMSEYLIYNSEEYGIKELLEVYNCIIGGLKKPIKQKYLDYLFKVIIPLHKLPTYSTFSSEITRCMIIFLEKCSELSVEIITRILRLLPRTDGEKASGFLQEIYEMLDSRSEFELNADFLNNLILFTTRMLLSDNRMLVESVIFMYQSKCISNFIMRNKDTIARNLVFYINSCYKCHWDIDCSIIAGDLLRQLFNSDEILSYYGVEGECNEKILGDFLFYDSPIIESSLNHESNNGFDFKLVEDRFANCSENHTSNKVSNSCDDKCNDADLFSHESTRYCVDSGLGGLCGAPDNSLVDIESFGYVPSKIKRYEEFWKKLSMQVERKCKTKDLKLDIEKYNELLKTVQIDSPQSKQKSHDLSPLKRRAESCGDKNSSSSGEKFLIPKLSLKSLKHCANSEVSSFPLGYSPRPQAPFELSTQVQPVKTIRKRKVKVRIKKRSSEKINSSLVDVTKNSVGGDE